jgi:ATP-binding cassette, subfamily B, bacterial
VHNTFVNDTRREVQLRSALGSLTGNLRRTWRLLDEIAPGVMNWLALASLVEASASIGTPYVTKCLIDTVAEARLAGGLQAIAPWLGGLVAIGLCGALAQRYAAYLTRILHVRGPVALTQLVLTKACNVAFTSFEDESFVNRLARAREDATVHLVPFATTSLTLGHATIVLLGTLALLWTTSPWTVPMLFVATVPSFIRELLVSKSSFALERKHMHRNRQGWYLEWLLTADQTAKELRALAAGRWLVRLHERVHAPFRDGQLALARAELPMNALVTFLSIAALNVPLVYVVISAATGSLSIGSMMLFILAFQQAAGAFGQLLGTLARALERDLYVRNVLSMLEVPEEDREVDLRREGLLNEAPEIVFEDVDFCYPHQATPILRGLNLRVRAGETLAIVGRNGAGKSTLVKVLLGLYAPQRGRILIGGIDCSTQSLAWRRQNIGVVFQDFIRFQFSARMNVGVGWWPDAENAAAAHAAFTKADAMRLVEKLPDGVESALGTAFGGSDLSGGQWQRIALARLFMRKSPIWILDEPTAAMDPETEEQTFRRFREWTAGHTAIMIAHRFSTVRFADRIAVIDDGRVTELGTHEELLVAGGHYAQMFALQASAYQSLGSRLDALAEAVPSPRPSAHVAP